MASPEWFKDDDFENNLECYIYYPPDISNLGECVTSSDGYTNEEMDNPENHIHPFDEYTKLLIPTEFWVKENGFETEKFVTDYNTQGGAFLSQC